jgi:hypothetical protein
MQLGDDITIAIIESSNKVREDLLGTKMLGEVIELAPKFTAKMTVRAGTEVLRMLWRNVPKKKILFMRILQCNVLQELKGINQWVGEVFAHGGELG